MLKKETPIKIAEYLYSDHDVMNMNFTARSIWEICSRENFEVLKELASLKMIRNFQVCICGKNMHLLKNIRKSSGYWWVCKSSCGKSKTVRANSIFENSPLSFETILIMVYYWSVNYTQDEIKRETQLSGNSVSEWCEFFRDIVAAHCMNFNEVIGGINADGEPIDVEIDESQFFKRKYNKGRLGAAIWVFGGIERNTRKCFLVQVDDRSRETLMKIIYSRIRPGSRIISDMWASYRCLYQSSAYLHEEINHSLNFVHPDDPEIHTQNVESMWCHAKSKLKKQHGTSRRLIDGYLIEFEFRYYHSWKKNKISNIFINILRNIDN